MPGGIVPFPLNLPIPPSKARSSEAVIPSLGYVPESDKKKIESYLQTLVAQAKAAIQGTGRLIGTLQHSFITNNVRSLGNYYLRAEVSFLNGQVVHYGTAGSIRFDVVFGVKNAAGEFVPLMAWDYKSGAATLTQARISHMQKVANYYIPIILVK